MYVKQSLSEFGSQNQHPQALKCSYTFFLISDALPQVFIEKALVQFSKHRKFIK